jgi:hypothetical protein
MTVIHQLTVLVALAVAVPAALTMQGKPNFGGTWTLKSSTPDGVLFFRPSLAVEHQGNLLTAGNPGDHHTETYTIDGKEYERKSGPSTVRLKAAWDGSTLVLERTSIMPGGLTRSSKDRWSLDADKLTIVTTTVANKTPVTVTSVYAKAGSDRR